MKLITALFSTVFFSAFCVAYDKATFQLTSQDMFGHGAFSKDELLFAHEFDSSTLNVVEIATQKVVPLKINQYATSLDFSPYKDLLFLIDATNYIVFDPRESRTIFKQPVLPDISFQKKEWAPDGSYLALTSIWKKKTIILDLKNNLIVKEIENCCESLEFSADSKTMAYVEKERQSLNLVTLGKEWKTTTMEGRFNLILPAYQTNRMLISEESNLLVLDAEKSEVLFELDIGGGVQRYKASKHSPIVIVEGEGKNVVLRMDTFNYKMTTSCKGVFGPVNSGQYVLFSPNEKYISQCAKKSRRTYSHSVLNAEDFSELWSQDFSLDEAENVRRGGYYTNEFSYLSDYFYVGNRFELKDRKGQENKAYLVNLATKETHVLSNFDAIYASLTRKGEVVFVSPLKNREILKYYPQTKETKLLLSLDALQGKGGFDYRTGHSKLFDAVSFSFTWRNDANNGPGGKSLGFFDSNTGLVRVLESPGFQMDPWPGRRYEFIQDGRFYWYKESGSLLRFYDLSSKTGK